MFTFPPDLPIRSSARKISTSSLRITVPFEPRPSIRPGIQFSNNTQYPKFPESPKETALRTTIYLKRGSVSTPSPVHLFVAVPEERVCTRFQTRAKRNQRGWEEVEREKKKSTWRRPHGAQVDGQLAAGGEPHFNCWATSVTRRLAAAWQLAWPRNRTDAV